jgi:hypothetical protein
MPRRKSRSKIRRRSLKHLHKQQGGYRILYENLGELIIEETTDNDLDNNEILGVKLGDEFLEDAITQNRIANSDLFILDNIPLSIKALIDWYERTSVEGRPFTHPLNRRVLNSNLIPILKFLNGIPANDETIPLLNFRYLNKIGNEYEDTPIKSILDKSEQQLRDDNTAIRKYLEGTLVTILNNLRGNSIKTRLDLFRSQQLICNLLHVRLTNFTLVDKLKLSIDEYEFPEYSTELLQEYLFFGHRRVEEDTVKFIPIENNPVYKASRGMFERHKDGANLDYYLRALKKIEELDSDRRPVYIQRSAGEVDDTPLPLDLLSVYKATYIYFLAGLIRIPIKDNLGLQLTRV